MGCRQGSVEVDSVVIDWGTCLRFFFFCLWDLAHAITGSVGGKWEKGGVCRLDLPKSNPSHTPISLPE